jgi:hypothetical protein
MQFRIMVALGIVVLIAGTTPAHHSFAADYFEDQTMTVSGELVEFDYRAPHAWVHVRGFDEQNRVQTYAAEWANPSRLSRDNVTKETLRPGDSLILTGSPGRNPQQRRLHLKVLERPSDGWRWEGFRRR